MYNVYSLTDGMVDRERSFDSLEEAAYYYADLVRDERDMRDTVPQYVETTVHLFDANESSMNMLAETCIGPRA